MFHETPSPRLFRNALEVIAKRYRYASVDDFEALFYEGKALKNSCLLSFDDGESSYYDVAYPIMREMGIPSLLFVCPPMISSSRNYWFQEISDYDPLKLKELISKNKGWPMHLLKTTPLNVICKSMKIDELLEVISDYQQLYEILPPKPLNMNVQQLKEVHDSGMVAIGAHSLNHPILANETDENSQTEIVESVSQLSEILGEQVRYFAIPNGHINLDYGDREIGFLKKSGIRLNFSTEFGNVVGNEDPFIIPRIGISEASKQLIRLKILMGKKWYSLKKGMGKLSELSDRKEFLPKVNVGQQMWATT